MNRHFTMLSLPIYSSFQKSSMQYAILSKQLSARGKMPSVREIAKLLHISPKTTIST